MSEAPSPDPTVFPPGFPPERCATYLEGNEGAPPREQLVRAVPHARPALDGTPPRALDIGCGPGREALFLVRAGYEVVAFDPYPIMIERTRDLFAREAAGPESARLVRLERTTLEEFAPSLEPSSFDLVHAGFVLPFVLPERFEECFSSITRCLRAGGVLCCQFFGRDDEFIRAAKPGTMSCQSREEIDTLLSNFDILEFEESNRQGRVGRGREKWWHVFHVTARHR